jgi:RHS repeat-associated protein
LNPVQELNSSNGVVANLLTGLSIDEYFTRTASGTTSTFLGDALGSTIGLVSANNGPIATNYTYQPFGATTVGGSANGNSYEFTGRENDGTGLYFYRARYYSPTFQRFIGQDPIGFRGGSANFYWYANNNPTTFTDRSGLTIWICGRHVKGWPFVGNHGYMWDDQNNSSCGNEGSSGLGPTSPGELGPGLDDCVQVQGSASHEDQVMHCCDPADPLNMNSGLWFPGLNDCWNKINRCLKGNGLVPPTPPVGRF